VAIVGGGYLGMWTAWFLSERGVSVVLLDRDRCGFGPSGRNGGFVSGYWDKLASLVERFGEDAALRLAEAADEAVKGIGSFCSEQGIDAWYRPAPHVEVASSGAQAGTWTDAVDACAQMGLSEHYSALDASEVASSHAWSPRFGGGASMPTGATVQPARLAFGLREALLASGVRIFERSRVTRVSDTGVETDGGGAVAAGRVVLAVNHAAGGLRPFKRMVSTASSHIVLTAPVPELLEQIGWTDGSGLSDCRTMLHYFRTTPDGRIAFGWGGGRMAYGSRRRGVLDVDPDAAARAERNLRRFFPALAGAPIEAAWGGPIDVSPIRLPQYRSVGRAVAGFGFTGNGVGPSYLGGQILSAMALDERNAFSSLPLVEPTVPLFPPEPFRFAGASVIRAAMVRDDDNADEGRASSLPVRLVAGMPKRLGMSLPR
jgi:glycine/D-amino acid oxidase-like deaminating enzyme